MAETLEANESHSTFSFSISFFFYFQKFSSQLILSTQRFEEGYKKYFLDLQKFSLRSLSFSGSLCLLSDIETSFEML